MLLDRFSQYAPLHEGVSAIVSHYTNIHTISKILRDDRMIASSTLENTSDGGNKNRNKAFYISFQRGKAAIMGYAGNRKDWACIVFNGTKLNARYKGTAIDYWAKPKNLQEYPSPDRLNYFNELEDRLVLDSPYLENVSRYVTEVHAVFDMQYRADYELLTKVCARRQVPLFWYATEADFNFKRKERAIQPDAEALKTEKPDYFTDRMAEEDNDYRTALYAVANVVPLLVYKDPKNRAKIDEIFPTHDPKKGEPDVYHQEFKLLQYQLRRYKDGDAESVLSDWAAAVRDIRQTQNPWVLKVAHLLAKDFKRYGATFSGDYLRNKLATLDQQAQHQALAKEQALNYVVYDDYDGYYNSTPDELNAQFYDEELREWLEASLPPKASADIAALLVRYDEATVKDLLDLLNRYLKPKQVRAWFSKRGDFRAVSQQEVRQFKEADKLKNPHHPGWGISAY